MERHPEDGRSHFRRPVRRGVPSVLFNMAASDHNDVIAEVFRARAVFVGSPTLNRGLLPTMMPVPGVKAMG
jgi:flavorubredoxin